MLYRFIILGVALAILAIALSALWSHEGRAAIKTLLLIPEVLPNAPIRPLTLFTRSTMKEGVELSYNGREAKADLYRPAGKGRHGAIVLFLGVNPDLVDPTFLKLAKGLARAGIVVLVPYSESLILGSIEPEEVSLIVASFRYLQGLEFVDKNRIGLAGFCVGASMVTLAAEDEAINQEVAFVNAFGAYYDGRDLLKAFATRTWEYRGEKETWTPHELTVDVLTRHLLENLEDPKDREILSKLFLEKDEGARERLSELSPQGLATYEVLSGTDAERVEQIMTDLPAKGVGSLGKLSPSSGIEKLKTKMFIMVDRDDTFVPSSESRRLRDALAGKTYTHYTEFSIFKHMHPEKPLPFLPFMREIGKLFNHLYLVMLQVT